MSQQDRPNDEAVSRTISIDGNSRIHYYEVGNRQNPPLLWLHGGTIEMGKTSLRDASFLADHYFVIVPDIRGYGESSGANSVDGHSIPNKAKDIGRLISRISDNPVAICGTSLGSAVALRLAIAEPHKVSRIVAMSPIPFATPTIDREWWLKNRYLVEQNQIEEFVLESIRFRTKVDMRDKLGTSKTIQNYILGFKMRTQQDLLCRIEEGYSRKDWVNECSAIQCEVLIISGEEDNFPTPSQCATLKEKLNKSKLQIITQAGHFPIQSHKKLVQEMILDYLAKI